ncbi:amino acid ABC transporter ATP-binding/permease protein [Brevundimonas sp. SGAir0440]|uniref:amino acid ABC transporter ATP-binding/permease protein n=1 Tax=Brevundimonas sp. SGAir0440 TaxID=2579977 RepID=UPI0010CD27CE|nr:ATP-binding cassette domain-containing protein [Brevundimonas sp. SGAir0440]QCQ97981.1 ATP-binding cassette domain-containing protein [Brevundimonas sp. SGAir0440]
MRVPSRIAGLIAAQAQAQRARLRLAAAGGAVVSVAAVCLLGLSGWFITGAAFAGLAGAAAAQSFNYMMPSAIIRLLAIVRTGGRYVERVAGHEAALKALARLRPQVFDAIATGPAERALNLSSGEVSARLVQDVDAVQTLFVRRSALWSLGAGAVSAILLATLASPLAGAALFVVMIAAVLGGVLIARRLADPAGRAVQTGAGAVKDRLAALEAAAPELKAYGLDDWACAQVAQVAANHDAAQIALTRSGGWMAVWQAAASALAVGVVIPAASSADLPLIALAALAAVMGVESAGGLVVALHQNGAAAQALSRLDAAMPMASPRHGRPLSGAAFGLANLNGELVPPYRLGIVGPSGAGKTTLIERLIGLRTPQTGEMRLGGLDAVVIAPEDRRRLFAYAAQDVRLLNGSVRENLLLAGPADDAALWAALDDAALGDRIRAESLGLDTPVGPNGEQLSGGERRRLGLARAYLRDAPWLVLDEPTEGLDAATEAQVLGRLLNRLAARGQGLILVGHRASPMALCNRSIRVEGLDSDGHLRLTCLPDDLAA